MTVGRARMILSSVWVFLTLPLIFFVTVQTVNGRYGEEWDAGFAWLMPLLFPILSFIIATWTISYTRRDRVVMRNLYVFVTTVMLSLFYICMLYFVLIRMPLTEPDAKHYIQHTLKASLWFLGALQALVVVTVGKFFLEEVSDHEADGSPHA